MIQDHTEPINDRYAATGPAKFPWTRALTLQERLSVSRNLSPRSDATRLFGRRLMRWSAQFKIDRDQLLDNWVNEFECRPPDILCAVVARGQVLKRAVAAPPTWVYTVQEVLRRACTEKSSFAFGANSNSVFQPVDAFIWPWLAWAQTSLADSLRQAGQRSPLEIASVMASFLPSLRERLFLLCDRTLALELNIARLRGDLRRETPRERYEEFCLQLAAGSRIVAIIREYPVLARIMAEVTQLWVTNTLQILKALKRDELILRERLRCGELPSALSKVRSGHGDYHCGGRSVTILESLHGQKVVYKPRSTKCECEFNRLLCLLKEYGIVEQSPAYRVIDRGEYGWCEFVQAYPCADDAERRQFFRAHGELLAIAWVFRLSDLNSENLLAVGGHPVVVDPECILQPYPSSGGASIEEFAMDRTLIKSGLLPAVKLGDNAVDMSGMSGGWSEVLSPFEVPVISQRDTDEAHIVHERIRLPIANNAPTDDPEKMDVHEYDGEILNGFCRTYDGLLRSRGLILASEPVQKLRDTVLRTIRRPTFFYAKLLRASVHPNLLRDALDRDVLFTRLWDGKKWNPRFVRQERTDLWRCDIPSFYMIPNSTALFTSDHTAIRESFRVRPFEEVGSRIRELSSCDVPRHAWTIHSALRLNARTAGSASWEWKPQIAADVMTSPKGWEAVAIQIADHLLELAICDNDRMSWIDVLPIEGNYASGPTGRRQMIPVSYDLHSGLGGYLLFLSNIGKVTPNHRYSEAAARLRRTIIKHLDGPNKPPFQMGLMRGVAGVLYVLAHTANLCDEPDVSLRTELIRHIQESVATDQHLDIVHGSAGALCALLSHHLVYSDGLSLEVALELATHLVKTMVKMPQGGAWRGDNGIPLTGFAHGAAGIAHALGKLHSLQPRDDFLNAILNALEYERSMFNEATANWRDLRVWVRGSQMAEEGTSGWCVGAAGVCLSRLGLFGIVETPNLLRDIELALQVIERRIDHSNQCLCHGDCGSIEALFYAGRILGQSAMTRKASRVVSEIVEAAISKGFCFDTGQETLSLMLGLAGCGYQLLRFAHEKQIPSLLMLAAPVRV